MELMKQVQYSPLTIAEMALSLFAVNEGYIDDVEVNKVIVFEKALHEFARSKHSQLLDKINQTQDYSEEIQNELKKLMEDFKSNGVW